MAGIKNRVLIFGGTSEGRELAEYAADHGVYTLVCVASEYGEQLLPEHEFLEVLTGRLDREAMRKLLASEKPELVLDATHPYAKVVTEQVRELCLEQGILLKRVVRSSSLEQEMPGDEGTERDGTANLMRYPHIIRVKTIKEAVKVLQADDEPVFLTTGSKELPVFASAEHLKDRIFARVLPDSRVLSECEKLGICGKHLIAMQGPFSREMNREMFRQTGAKWLVTKESGAQGGFEEKLLAAADRQLTVIVVERPEKEAGISLAEAKRLLDPYASIRKRTLSLIGMGMGGGNQLTLEALEEIKRSDAVLGAPRMLADIDRFLSGKQRAAVYMPDAVIEWMGQHPEARRTAIIYSGDTGFYSGCGSLIKRLKETGEWGKLEIKVFPGISSVSSLCAGFCTSWEDVCLASAHGRACDPVGLLRLHPRVFLLLGGTENLGSICRRLADSGYGSVQVKAAIRMGYPDGKWIRGTAKELADSETDGLAAVLLERNPDDLGKGSENDAENQ